MMRYTNFKTSLKYVVPTILGDLSAVWAEGPSETYDRLKKMKSEEVDKLLSEKGSEKERFFVLEEHLKFPNSRDFPEDVPEEQRLNEEAAKKNRKLRKSVLEVTYREYKENSVTVTHMNANDGQGGLVSEKRRIEYLIVWGFGFSESGKAMMSTTIKKNNNGSGGNSCCKSFFHLLLLIGLIAIAFALIRNNGRLFKARVLPVLKGDFSCTRTTEDFSSCDESSSSV